MDLSHLVASAFVCSPVQVKDSVSVYSDRDSDRDRDKKNIDKIYNYRVRDTDAMKP